MEEWGVVGEGLAGSIMPASAERQDAYHAFMTRRMILDASRRVEQIFFLHEEGITWLGSSAAPTYLTGKG